VPGAVWQVRERLSALRARVCGGDAARLLPAFADWCDELDSALDVAEETARDTLGTLHALAERVERLVAEMDFGFLYDRRRRLFHIGYRVDEEAADPAHYDLLASEARVASLLAIAKHDVPLEHWRRLGRPFAVRQGRRVLLSWGGTAFEYLMPRLFMRSYHGTLLDQSCAGALEIQRGYRTGRGRPWGVSESAYNRVDSAGVYQYKAFGVPDLGLKRGLGDDLVVAPYASIIGLPYDHRAVLDNLRTLESEGALGRYGFYDALDYTPSRLPLGANHAVVSTFMAHHQAMSMIALCNFLRDDVMVERFHADARVRTVEPLLQERLPARVMADRAAPEVPPAPRPRPQRAAQAWRVAADGPVPAVHCLSNGRYAVLITGAGAGQSRWNGVALTRWRADPTLEDLGHWIYIRDGESGRVWSLARQPVAAGGVDEDTLFFPHKVEFRRRQGAITGRVEILVGVADDVEIRRVTLTNSSDRARTLQVVSYAEVALAHHAADRRHPAFQKLFVEARAVLDGHGLLFRRRPRQADDPAPALAHAVVLETGSASNVGLCADREAFLGRGRTAARAAALDPSSEKAPDRQSAWGAPPEASLDPVHAIAVDVTVPPHASIRLAYVSAAGPTDEDALRTLSGYTTWSRLDAAGQQARLQAEQEMRRFDLTSPAIAGYQRLLSALLFRDPGLGAHRGRREARGAPAEAPSPAAFDRSALWARGISGDHPILLVRVEDSDHLALVQTVLGAHAFWRRRGLRVDLVIADTRTAGYDLDIQNRLDRLLIRRGDDAHVGEKGGIFTVRAALLPPGEMDFLEGHAAVVLAGAAGPLDAQLAGGADPTPTRLPVFRPSRVDRLAEDPPAPPSEPLALLFPTPWGGFSRDGREYVIRVADASPVGRPPAPWCNVIANDACGFLTSESALGCPWAGDSGEDRLSPWHHGPVSDPPSEAVYVRDEETAAIWSATPAPAGAGAAFQVAHGPGYTRYSHSRHGLRQTLTAFADTERPIKYLVLDVHNAAPRPRRLTVTYYVPWVLGSDREETRAWVVPSYEPAHHALLASAAHDASFGRRVAFAASTRPLHGLTADRREFLGRLGTRERPAGLVRIGLSGTVRPGLDPCAAIQVHVDLEPDAADSVVFLLGQGDDRESALALLEDARRPDAVEHARAAVDALWKRTLGAVRVSTPDAAFDVLLNRWLPYQVLACRMWARSGFYQSSGAYGFRDQLQDALALCHARPDIAREQILRAAAHQFPEGDVLHWWHPPADRGVRTRISDDLLWLPYAAAHYVETTGDATILDEPAPFLSGAPLDPAAESAYAAWPTSTEEASLFEHCRRAIEKGSTAGPHGLPLIGGGDWNDGLNRVGAEGSGESVWLGWFLHDVLTRFARLSRDRGLSRDADGYVRKARELAEALEASGWDGEWYRRGYYDDGTPLGSASSLECRIYAIAQSWSVLSGAAPEERQRRALASLAEHLVRDDARVSLLLAPPFDRTPHDPGYIKGYRPGIRENGGQYTHAAVWTAWAFAELGDGEEALRLFGHASPVRHAETPERARRYRVEPYATAGDVYGVPPWLGRGGWTWYTGSAAWLYRLGLERILGLRRSGSELRIEPRVPATWRRFRVEYPFGTARYLIDVRIQGGEESSGAGGRAAEPEILVDGRSSPDGAISLVDDGREHAVRVTLGADAARALRASRDDAPRAR
jgi:cyclic beta-1,2-glucan synthetase